MVFRQRNSQRFAMNMSAAERARPPRRLPIPFQGLPARSTRKKSMAPRSRALPPGGGRQNTSGAIPAVPSCTSTTRSTNNPASNTSSCATSRPPCTPPMATPAPRAKSASPGHLGAWRHQCHHRHRDGHMDSIPMVIITGQVPTHAIGQGCLPGMRRRGHHPPIVKHNFLVKDVRDLAVTPQEGLPHRPHWPAWPRGGGHPQRRLAQDQAYTGYPEAAHHALVQPGAQRPRRADPQGAQLLLSAQAPVHLHGRRRGARQCLWRAAAAGGLAGLPGHQHLMGLGAFPASNPQFRHAGHARHLRGQHGHAELRRAAGRRRALR